MSLDIALSVRQVICESEFGFSKSIFIVYAALYVAGFQKTCIVHTSNFSVLVTHKINVE